MCEERPSTRVTRRVRFRRRWINSTRHRHTTRLCPSAHAPTQSMPHDQPTRLLTQSHRHTHRRQGLRERMLNEALLPKRDEPAAEPTTTRLLVGNKAATAAAATASEDGEPELDRADMNRDILLAAAGLLPDSVDSAAAQVGLGWGGLGFGCVSGFGFLRRVVNNLSETVCDLTPNRHIHSTHRPPPQERPGNRVTAATTVGTTPRRRSSPCTGAITCRTAPPPRPPPHTSPATTRATAARWGVSPSWLVLRN